MDPIATDDGGIPPFEGKRPTITAPAFKYAERQRAMDSHYVAAYRRWIASLPANERARVELLGVADPQLSYHEAGDAPGFDVERATGSSESDRSDDLRLALSEAFSDFLHWLTFPPGQRGLNARAIGCRVIMALWVIRPDIIGNLSLVELGALVDARPEVLSRQATAFSNRFGIRGRAQFSAKTRKAQRDAAKRRCAHDIHTAGLN